eukprot:Platyproteum_vivax@DN7131_c0_g1_i1.p2
MKRTLYIKSSDFETLVDSLLDVTAREDERVIVGLGGVPGSGKTTLAERVCAYLNDKRPSVCAVVAMDGFHFSRSQLDKMPNPQKAHKFRGAPWTFDVEAYAECLRTIRFNRFSLIGVPTFDHELKDPVVNGSWIGASVKIIVTEGLYVLLNEDPWNLAGDLVHLRWFIDIDLEEAGRRTAQRHVRSGICPDLESAQNRWEEVDKLNAIRVLDHLDRSDLDVVIKVE